MTDAAAAFTDLTVAQLDEFEIGLGSSIVSTKLSARDVRRLLSTTLVSSFGAEQAERLAGEMTVADVGDVLAHDDLPNLFSDGIPVDGSRTTDRWIVMCAKAFNWPPDVTRRQTIRDIRLLIEALGETE